MPFLVCEVSFQLGLSGAPGRIDSGFRFILDTVKNTSSANSFQPISAGLVQLVSYSVLGNSIYS